MHDWILCIDKKFRRGPFGRKGYQGVSFNLGTRVVSCNLGGWFDQETNRSFKVKKAAANSYSIRFGFSSHNNDWSILSLFSYSLLLFYVLQRFFAVNISKNRILVDQTIRLSRPLCKSIQFSRRNQVILTYWELVDLIVTGGRRPVKE